MIDLENVRKSFAVGGREQDVLRGVSLHLGRGESLAIKGPSGSGKSTLLNLVAGLERADAGNVLVDGRDVGAMNDEASATFRRDRIGFVFQDHRLFEQLTAIENVMLPSLAVPVADAAERARELLARVGIAAMEEKFPGELSGGERQRVAIARALFLRPAILLADEPTGALDKENAKQFLDLLAPLVEGGMCILVATHSDFVASRMQRVEVLDDGVFKKFI